MSNATDSSTNEWSPMCEAQERNQRALYELELQWGAGRLNYGLIKDILRGRGTGDCDGHNPLQRQRKQGESKGIPVKLVP